MTGADIVAAAHAQIGTPFVHQGRIPGKALDCAGLLVTVAAAIGAEYVDVAGYSRIPTGVLAGVMESQPCLVRIKVAEATAGDVLVMRFAKDPQHLAVLAGDTIIHSHAAVRMCCEHAFDDTWRRRVVTAWRFIGGTA